MKILAVLFAALLADIPWGTNIDQYRAMGNSHCAPDGVQCIVKPDGDEDWQPVFRRSRCHSMLDDIEIKPDPPEWFDSLQYKRTLLGTRRTWPK